MRIFSILYYVGIKKQTNHIQQQLQVNNYRHYFKNLDIQILLHILKKLSSHDCGFHYQQLKIRNKDILAVFTNGDILL